jgi:hypothetical protein
MVTSYGLPPYHGEHGPGETPGDPGAHRFAADTEYINLQELMSILT